MKNFITYLRQYFTKALLFVLITFATQVGGVVYLMCLPIFRYIKPYIARPIGRIAANTALFILLYSVITFYIVPPMAAKFGRVPLPVGDEHPYLKQWNWGLCYLNRHYVVPQLRTTTEGVATKLAEKYPGSVTAYLESGFPFFDGYPLLPHRSHNDGRKIDLCFFYTDTATQKPSNERPSWLGYGICEEPKAGEENRPGYCAEKGFWQYSFLQNYIVPQGRKKALPFDAKRTADLIRFFIADSHIQLILIEPHLKTRLGLQQQNKIRTPPCASVRHDDHIHVGIY